MANYLNRSIKSLINATVPKNRRPKFELQLKIIDLNNVPLVSGNSYVKWHLPSSTSAEHRGRTSKAIIREHKVSWEYEKTLPVRLTVDRNGMLQETEIHFEIMQEYSSGARGERIILGTIKINLAEYVEGSDDAEDGVCRRYLMQESKINSTLKISILMKQTEGDRTFVCPPLKTAAVFGGIAGIMTAEQGDPDDLGHMPSMSKKTRELGKLQDMYRRTLAASWAAQAGELPADKCIEDIFAGGDGWGGQTQNSQTPQLRPSDDSTEDRESDTDRRTVRRLDNRASSYGSLLGTKPRHSPNNSNDHSIQGAQGVSGRASIEQQVHSNANKSKPWNAKRSNEINELSAREDLRSWHISTDSRE
ncbi:MAG: hypothetical protein HETSPECPRED_007672 [Heterodermia speciosa]|uniref:C2 NT-type domain-containing protein n=1 Tax=Heterodermia speciosa TaxID=116794 RepID=A0A8H3G006_9LECA|nr:MAG: hypothetical protein HETSPECPRED_007672 [Heterodermia speciosa]